MFRDLSEIPRSNIAQAFKDCTYSLTRIIIICKCSIHETRLTVKNQKPNQMTGSGLAKEFVPQQYQGYYWSCGEPDTYNNGVGKKTYMLPTKYPATICKTTTTLRLRYFPKMPQHNIKILTLIKETLSQTVHVLNCFFILAKEGIISVVCSFIAKGKQICHN